MGDQGEAGNSSSGAEEQQVAEHGVSPCLQQFDRSTQQQDTVEHTEAERAGNPGTENILMRLLH